ncbi:MAG: hypothetical protein ABIH46_11420, partial [Chloroflexota bacterium]
GYKVEEIGVLAAGKGKKQNNWLEVPGGRPVVGAGPVEKALSGAKGDAAAALASLWNISEETARYYLFGASTGGVVVSIQGDEARVGKAQDIMREIQPSVLAEKCSVEVTSPGFSMAERMTSTNVSDAKLSGDFRKY